MRLTFLGAAGEVTGSSTLVDMGRSRLLVDFGLHQGDRSADERNRRSLDFQPRSLDAVLLTHAHLDHSGRLPLLARAGFRGPIHATRATIDLCAILLRDSAHLQGVDADRETRRALRAGGSPVRPLYSLEEVEEVLSLMRPVDYEEPVAVAPGVAARFVDAGHILGSASIELAVSSGGQRRTIVFSGDIGVKGAPLLSDPVRFQHADAVVLESTYGDRDHRSNASTLDEFAQVLASARARGGKVLVPAFAVGRTQALIYHVGELKRAGRLDHTVVYIDSPMAIEATELYSRHRELFDEQTWTMIRLGQSPLAFRDLHFTRTAEESKRLNSLNGGIIIIAASGMCTGGRILHHLRHNLSSPATSVVLVGFQAEGTLGRQLVDRAPSVMIMGERVEVHASVHTLGGFSAHAGQTELLEWAASLAPSRPRVFLNHGEAAPRAALAACLRSKLGLPCELPGFRSVAELDWP